MADTPLLTAVIDGDVSVAMQLLDAAANDGIAVDLNLADKDGNTALIIAAYKVYAGVVAALLAAPSKDGVAVDLNLANNGGETALILAADNGHAGIVAALLATPGKDGVAVDLNLATIKTGNTALIRAAASGRVEIVAALLAAPGKDGVAADLNLADKDGHTALMVAAVSGHVEIVAALLAATGKDEVAVDLNLADKKGNTALIAAAANGHVNVVAALVAAPGKDGVAVDLNLANKDGNTALMVAAGSGHPDVIAALVAAPGKDGVAVDLNLVNKYGGTALFAAASNGYFDVIAALVAVPGKDGVAVDLGTALIFAVTNNCSTEIVATLVAAHGKNSVAADPNLASKDVNRALTCCMTEAVRRRHIAIVKLLLDHPACVDKDVLAAAEACGDPESICWVQEIQTKACAACGADRYHFMFSKKQLKLSGTKRRCADCVNKVKQGNPPFKTTADADAAPATAASAQSGSASETKQTSGDGDGGFGSSDDEASAVQAAIAEVYADERAEVLKKANAKKSREPGAMVKAGASVIAGRKIAKGGRKKRNSTKAAHEAAEAETRLMSASGGGGAADPLPLGTDPPPGGDAVAKRKLRHKFCAYCKKPGAHLKCDGCLQRKYCDKKCQKNDWKALHKRQCKKLQQMSVEEAEPLCPLCLHNDDDAHVGGLPSTVCYACGQSYCGACSVGAFIRSLRGCPLCREPPTLSEEEEFARCWKLVHDRPPGRHTKHAQGYLGRCYMHGVGATQDDDEAFKWFKRAADNGSGSATVVTACFYLDGVGVAKDVATGVEYLQRGAEQCPAGTHSNAAAMQQLVSLQECGVIPAPQPGATASPEL